MTTETVLSAKVVGTNMFRPCVECGKTKNRYTGFRPRKSRCEVHKGKGNGEGSESCKECKALRNHHTRQPRCIECDSARSAKKAKGKNPVKVTAKKPKAKKAKKAKQVAAEATVPVVQVPAPVQAQSPEPTEPTAIVTKLSDLLGESTAPVAVGVVAAPAPLPTAEVEDNGPPF